MYSESCFSFLIDLITYIIIFIETVANNDDNSEMCAVVCGSRAHLESEAMAQRSAFRTVLMIGFHIHVWLFGVRSIKDTQCGFKLFTRPAARILFDNLHVDRWYL